MDCSADGRCQMNDSIRSACPAFEVSGAPVLLPEALPVASGIDPRDKTRVDTRRTALLFRIYLCAQPQPDG